MHTVVAGGTGFLGTALTSALINAGHEVSVLTRTPRAANHVHWDPTNPLASWPDVIGRADAVINLAGEPLNARRWTTARKQALRRSRIVATQALVSAIRRATKRPLFLSGSAIGFYGTDRHEALDEGSSHGSDFLADLCVEWEQTARGAEPVTRVVLLRTGVVLAREGGAFPELARPFKFFAGGPIASGRQVVSWIHVDDWVGMTLWALENAQVAGPLNLTAPNPVTNAELAKAIGHAVHRPSFVPAPAFAVRLLVGEMADAAILNGQCVIPAKAQSLGYRFVHPTIDKAVTQIARR
jgi:uncharacterized protein (TIGR01777 family)